MPRTPNRGNVIRCGYDPATKQKAQEIFVKPAAEKAREDFCIFFNITHDTLSEWLEDIRAVLRQSSGHAVHAQSSRIVNGKKFVFAEPGMRKWWQLEPGKHTDFLMEDAGLVTTVAGLDSLKHYFARAQAPGLHVGHEVTEVENCIPIRRWEPSLRSKQAMLRDLLVWAASDMRIDERLWKRSTENQVRKHALLNPEYGKTTEVSPSKRQKRSTPTLKLTNCDVFVTDRNYTSIRDVDDNDMIIVGVRNLLKDDADSIGDVDPQHLSWEKLKAKVEKKWDLSLVADRQANRDDSYLNGRLEFTDAESKQRAVRDDATLMHAVEHMFALAKMSGKPEIVLRFVPSKHELD